MEITPLQIRAQVTTLCIMRTNLFLTKPPISMTGKWELTNGSIKFPQNLKAGQWIWIEPATDGALLVDRGAYKVISKLETTTTGEYLYELEGLKDYSDTWTGTIWAQAIPPSVVELARRMVQFEIDNPKTNVISHSVSGMYSEQLARSAVEDGGIVADAWEIFRKEITAIPKGFVTGVRY